MGVTLALNYLVYTIKFIGNISLTEGYYSCKSGPSVFVNKFDRM